MTGRARIVLGMTTVASLISLVGLTGPVTARAAHQAPSPGAANLDLRVPIVPPRALSRPGALTFAPAGKTNVDTTPVTAAQDETTLDSNPLDPSIRVGGQNDYRAAPNGDVNCGFSHTSDAGVTWSSGVLAGVTRNNPGTPFDYDAAGDPTVFYGDNGTVYFGCLAFDRSYARSAMLIARSNDGGATWSKPFAVAQSDTGTLFHDKEMITVDNSPNSPFHGRVYMAWTEFMGNPDESPSVEVVSRSSDGGKTWSAPVNVSGAPGGVEGSHPAVGPDGSVYVAWCSGSLICVNGSAASTIEVVRSTDGGKTWTAPVSAASLTSLPASLPGNSFRINSLPTTAVNPSNGDVYVSYAGEGKNANVYFARSVDHGATWSSPVKMAPAKEDQFFQWMRVSPTGRIRICYYDQHWNTGTLLDMSCTSSTDGVTFTKARRFTTQSSDPSQDGFGGAFIGDYTGLALDAQGSPHPLWTDTRTGNADTWTAN